jgi:hypothetical protein
MGKEMATPMVSDSHLCPGCRLLEQAPQDKDSYEEIDPDSIPYGTFRIDGQSGMTLEGLEDRKKRTPFVLYFHNITDGRKFRISVPIGPHTAGEELYNSAQDSGTLVGKTFGID